MGKQYKAIILSDNQPTENTWGDIVEQNGNLFAEVKTKHLSTFIVTSQQLNRFQDVKETAWYHDAVSYAVSKGWMNGVSSGIFEPDSSMTRAMLTTVLYRLEGKPSVSGASSYTDVTSGTWYTDAVIWASNHKIVSGYGNGLFGTNQNITREELAVMLRNYAAFKNGSAAKSNDLSVYSDTKEISPWALDAMKWANAEGLLLGRSDKTLAPKGTATRAEVATLLMRFVTSMGR